MWPFDLAAKKRAAADDLELKNFDDFEQNLRNNGFIKWLYLRPPHGEWVECRRYEWATSKVWRSGNEPPYFNIAGLWWRPWKGETIEGDVVDGIMPLFTPSQSLHS